MSNDHNTINRSLCIVANCMNIKTVYVQHSPVNQYFPRMIFRYAFVDGTESEMVYKKNDNDRTHYIKLGALRYVELYPLKKIERKGVRVLVCVNKLDDVEVVNSYLNTFVKSEIDFKVRLHPAMKSDKAQNLELRPLSECLVEYKYVLAGDSGVLVDAVVAGSIALYAVDMSTLDDIYGYARNQIAKEVSTRSIVDLINEEQVSPEKQLKYCTFYDASCDCVESSKLISSYRTELEKIWCVY
ncbi:hypothetical protein [Vibrio sp. 14G-20]|nr:hypothetical protein [Vibrio sp. 14G-20]